MAASAAAADDDVNADAMAGSLAPAVSSEKLVYSLAGPSRTNQRPTQMIGQRGLVQRHRIDEYLMEWVGDIHLPAST